jgi:hypothetical protein
VAVVAARARKEAACRWHGGGCRCRGCIFCIAERKYKARSSFAVPVKAVEALLLDKAEVYSSRAGALRNSDSRAIWREGRGNLILDVSSS